MLDPDAVRFLQQSEGQPPSWTLSIEENRARVGPLAGNGPDVGVRDVEIPLKGRTLKARIYRAHQGTEGTEAAPVTLFFHGGGWIMGSVDSHDHLARMLCYESAGTVLSVEYRLAPEHQCPAAANDAYDAAAWASEQLAGGGPVLVAGDSAGGNLAAVTALLARDRGGPLLAMQILIYPITDCQFDTPSYREYGEGLNLTARDMQFFWDMYCPDPRLRVDPIASPLQTYDLSRLPPAVLVLAGNDPLYSEGKLYGERLRRAGTEVTEFDCSGMVHGFMRRVGSFEKAREVAAEIGSLIRSS